MTLEAREIERIRISIMNSLQAEINVIQEFEDNGYTLDDSKYTEGIAFWYYSHRGFTQITCMHALVKPVYPDGDWMYIAETHDGNIAHENSHAVAANVASIYEDEFNM